MAVQNDCGCAPGCGCVPGPLGITNCICPPEPGQSGPGTVKPGQPQPAFPGVEIKPKDLLPTPIKDLGDFLNRLWNRAFGNPTFWKFTGLIGAGVLAVIIGGIIFVKE